MNEELNDFPHHKSLNIVQTLNKQLYTTHVKHNNYLSAFQSSLKEKSETEDHGLSHLSLKKSNFQLSFPYPISEPFHWTIQNDPCLELPKEKAEFNQKLANYKQYYKKHKKAVNIRTVKNTTKEFISVPQYLVDLTMYGDKNPYFHGHYDWFYTKGSLTQVEVNNKMILMSVQGRNIMSTSMDNEETQPLDIFFTSLHPIYNIQGYNINNKSFLTLRSRNEIQIELIDQKARSPKLSNETIYKCINKVSSAPFIDCMFLDENKLITADVTYEVKIHDLEEKKISHKRNFEKESENKGDLCQLQSISNFLLFMSTSNLTVLDFRSANDSKERTKQLKNGFFTCDNLCTLCTSSINENFVYVASKHNIYKVDIREMEVVKQWAHLLDNSPIVMKTLPFENGEYIFVASFTETICIVVSSDNHLPFKIKTIGDTYTELQLKHEFELREDIQARNKLSTIGLEVTDSHLYSTNSIGDIYKYYFIESNDEESFFNQKAVKKLQDFIDEVPFKPKTLKPTHFKEMSALKHIVCKDFDDNNIALKPYWKPNTKLKKYLNPDKKYGQYEMSKIWGYNRAEVDPAIDIEQPMDRIGSWLAHSTAINFDENIDEDDNIELDNGI